METRRRNDIRRFLSGKGLTFMCECVHSTATLHLPHPIPDPVVIAKGRHQSPLGTGALIRSSAI
jgi:hypothetical protein